MGLKTHRWSDSNRVGFEALGMRPGRFRRNVGFRTLAELNRLAFSGNLVES
jgi:hypothetical protein